MSFSARKETFVGAVTFFLLLVLIFISNGTTHKKQQEDGYVISAVFSHIDGLAEDADIRMGGVRVGQVNATKLNDEYRAVVSMMIDEGVEIPFDTSAAIHTDGLFGGKFIELEPGGSEKFMRNGDIIDLAKSSVVVEELLDLIISEGKAKRAKQKEILTEGVAE